MGGIENTPFAAFETQGVLQALKHQVSTVRTETVPAQCGKCEGMRRRIRGREFSWLRNALRIEVGQPVLRQIDQAVNLISIGGFPLELPYFGQVV